MASSIFLAILLTMCVVLTLAQVDTISECKALKPRTEPPKDVTDLRVDDIKIVGALGDSIIAGFGISGVNHGPEGSGIVNASFLAEIRGRSFAIGGDPGAVTLANFIKHFSPKLKGSSVWAHPVTRCMGDECNDVLALHYPLFDGFNAALSGPLSSNLNYEVDYLIKEMKKMSKRDFEESWKLITIQIGCNDQCHSCKTDEQHSKFMPELYGKNVEEAVDRILKEIPRVVINLFGSFKISRLVRLVRDQNDYCHYNYFFGYDRECICGKTEEGLNEMDATSDAYNKELERISEKYRGQPGGSSAVMYNPAPIDLLSFPIDAISNIDCFHPNLKGHQWFAKILWNEMFLNKQQKPSKMHFDDSLKIYCPTENDRFPTV